MVEVSFIMSQSHSIGSIQPENRGWRSVIQVKPIGDVRRRDNQGTYANHGIVRSIAAYFNKIRRATAKTISRARNLEKPLRSHRRSGRKTVRPSNNSVERLLRCSREGGSSASSSRAAWA